MVNSTLSQSRQDKKQRLWIEIGSIIAVIILFSIILPFVISPFRLQLFGRFLALAMVALGIDLIWGYTGLLSLGHGIFFALGGYAFAMHLKLQIPQGQLPDFFTLYGVTELPLFWKPFHSFPFTVIAIFLIP
ncbi:MAG: urea ABC transporter permease subunit UrtC, partial [Cyanobacteria bacterium]|nr:urea ABC transporter permease subunit UrtC [Cyanobacteria bacterium CG_2015-02_32_10]